MSSGAKFQVGWEEAPNFTSHGALNIVESATYCGVHASAIEAAVRDGHLKARRLGRNLIILRSDLDEFLEGLDVVRPHTPPSVLKRQKERANRRTQP